MTGGVGQVLFSVRNSTTSVVQITTKFNGVTQDTISGVRLNNVAGAYFVAMVPAGTYQLTVEAADGNGCTDGGNARPMTVTVTN